MAGLTTKKTLKGISMSMNKLLDIEGTLGVIDADSDSPEINAALRRCRGLTAALIVATEEFQHHCHALKSGTHPAKQMSIDALLKGVAARTGESDDDGDLGEALAGIDED